MPILFIKLMVDHTLLEDCMHLKSHPHCLMYVLIVLIERSVSCQNEEYCFEISTQEFVYCIRWHLI